MAVASETCECCGAKGDPVAGIDGHPSGSRCAACRTPAERVLPREWSCQGVADHPDAVSPGQWTADIRGGAAGSEGTTPTGGATAGWRRPADRRQPS